MHRAGQRLPNRACAELAATSSMPGGVVVHTSPHDGVHLDKAEHTTLGPHWPSHHPTAAGLEGTAATADPASAPQTAAAPFQLSRIRRTAGL